ncbi:MAG: HEAT repeat domain-containing protein, partial [Planctomycetota bacterium]
MPNITRVALVLLIGVAAPAGRAQTISYDAQTTPRDVFGRRIPWGAAFKRRMISLRTGAGRLLVGQPLEVFIYTPPPRRPPYVRLDVNVPGGASRLSLTDEAGRSVRFDTPVHESSHAAGAWAILRITRRGPHAVHGHLKPGWYKLVVRYARQRRDPRDPKALVGAGRSNELSIHVVDLPADAGASETLARQIREDERAGRGGITRITSLVAALGAPDRAQRQQAEDHLRREALPAAVPLLEEVAGSDNPEVSMRAKRLLRSVLSVVVRANQAGPYGRGAELLEDGPFLGQLSDVSWELVREFAADTTYQLLRIKAARYAPLALAEMSKPTEAQVARVLAGLKHQDPAVRIVAVRSITQTSDPRILRGLMQRLSDPYTYLLLSGPGEPVPRYPVVEEAAAALRAQGASVIAPLVRFTRDGKYPRALRPAVEVLGSGPPTDESVAFLSELLESGARYKPQLAVQAMAQLMPATTAQLAKLARDSAADRLIRRQAIDALGKATRADAVEDTLLAMLRHKDDQFVAAAARAAGQLRLVKAVPDLKRIAANEKRDQNVRYPAVSAVADTLPRPEAGRWLMSLAGKGVHGGVRGHVIRRLGAMEYR